MKICPILQAAALPSIVNAIAMRYSEKEIEIVKQRATCLRAECAWWDGYSCSENPAPLLKTRVELEDEIKLDIFKEGLKSDIEKVLSEKTGWGRIELKKRLFDMIDGAGLERTELYDIHSEKEVHQTHEVTPDGHRYPIDRTHDCTNEFCPSKAVKEDTSDDSKM